MPEAKRTNGRASIHKANDQIIYTFADLLRDTYIEFFAMIYSHNYIHIYIELTINPVYYYRLGKSISNYNYYNYHNMTNILHTYGCNIA